MLVVSHLQPIGHVAAVRNLLSPLFQTMVGWICVRQSLLLSDWLFRILKKLNSLNKNSVLIEVSHLTIEKVRTYLLISAPPVRQ